MLNGILHNPVKTVFGKDSLSELPPLIAGYRRIFLVYGGGSIKSNGVYDAVLKQLNGFEVYEFSGIEPNPQLSSCETAIKSGRTAKVDFVLAVGGGSVIDACKLIAAGIATPNVEPWDLVLKPSLIEAALPLGTVLTLPAAGSENNSNSVISRKNPDDKRGWSSPLVYPVFSIMDPSFTTSLPLRQTANGLVDTWVHICEQYLTRDAKTPVQDRFAEGLLSTLLKIGPQLLVSPKDYELRSALMWTSSMALHGILGVGVVHDWATHAIGHELTALYGIDHARTLAIALPGVLSHKKQAKKAKLLMYARMVWGLHQGDEDVLCDEAIARTVLFFESLGVHTTLRDYKLGAEAAQAVADRIAQKGWKLGEDGDIDAAAVKQILTSRLG